LLCGDISAFERAASCIVPPKGEEMTDFHVAMKAANVLALWELDYRRNSPPELPHVWHWQTIDPLLDEAVRATSIGNAERRVLVLSNPNLNEPDANYAVGNLSVNVQVLMPGERARPHRHSMHALRFVIEGSGVTTVVEGKSCPMLPGDLVLTPSMTWHEHVHEGEGRGSWVDALDVPFQNYLKNAVFEPGPVGEPLSLPPDSAFVGAGLMAATPITPTPYSPMFRYPWETAVRALQALPPSPDGSRKLRYTNPINGGAVMSTLDCYLLGLEKGVDTRPVRANCNAACAVAEGEGSSTIGEQTIHWGKNDIFTLPHGQWISHKASAPDTKLFQITDREIFRRLDLLREEEKH
jgi:gentisate 1,2-dioxygenase